MLLVLSADNLCKQFGPRSGLACPDCLTLMVIFLIDLSCSDPENFVRGSPTRTLFFVFFLVEEMERGSKCNLKWAIIHAKQHFMAFC